MDARSNDGLLEQVEQIIGYRFKDEHLLAQSLLHASVADQRTLSNERLEFLGDAILGMVICERLYMLFPDRLEGDLTKIKSSVVSRRTCAEIAEEIGLDQLLTLGKGMHSHGMLPTSLSAAVFEAMIGALYIDGGFEVSRSFILNNMDHHIESAAKLGHQHNFKSVLQQVSQDRFSIAPLYHVLDEKGPDHAKCFEICVEVGPRRFGPCWGTSKKQAEQQAALTALLDLQVAKMDEKGDVHIEGGDMEIDLSSRQSP